jgi:hypothetical protein
LKNCRDSTRSIKPNFLLKLKAQMEPYRVFISSIMNRSIEDLLAEREAARAAIDHFAPMATAWAFEAEPASAKPLLDFYIDAVKTSDMFVLILGQHVTPPVKKEFDTARDHGKPILTFCKSADSRDAETEVLLRSLNAKYDPFENAFELREKLRKSLGLHLLSLIRGDEAGLLIRPGDRIARLRKYALEHKKVNVLPTVPACEYNSFTVSAVEATTVVFHKGSNRQDVIVPRERIDDVLEAGSDEPALVHLNGRLQWLTLQERWRFFPERPPSNDLLCAGLGKQVAFEGQFANQMFAQLRSAGYRARWSRLDRAPEANIFFDEDGRHVTNGSQILVCWKGELL